MMDLYSSELDGIDFESYSYAIQVHCETYTVPDNYVGNVRVIERFFEVPLDYANPYAEKIRLFARQAIPIGPSSLDEALRPVCLFFPDFTAYDSAVALPMSYTITKPFFDRGYQMFFLDQRGTGLSSPLNSLTFKTATLNSHPLDSAELQADYASFFRADNIVRDAEEIRKFLLQGGRTQEDKKWTICGNAHSGFLCAVYLSFFSGGVKKAYVTAGIPPLMSDPYEVFKYVFEKAKERNALYYEKFPGDIVRVREILSFITEGGRRGIPMEGGGILSAERFQCLHIGFGMLGSTDGLHHLILRGSNDLKLYGELSHKFMEQLRALQGFDKNILHSILQETVYCQGQASIWSESRLRSDRRFCWSEMQSRPNNEPVYFTGEILYPEFWEDFAEVEDLRPVAEIIATRKMWPAVYDEDQLARNEVPLVLGVYIYDAYISFDVSRAIAKIKNTRPFITNVLYHDARTRNADDTLPQLFALGEEPPVVSNEEPIVVWPS